MAQPEILYISVSKMDIMDLPGLEDQKKVRSSGENNTKQYFAALIATLTFFMMGSHSGWSGPTLFILLAKESPIATTSSEASWLAAHIQMGAMVGPILTAIGAKFLGRKPLIIIIAPLFLVSSLLISFADHIDYLLYARFICGLAYGCAETVLPLFIGEISSPSIRGKLGAYMLILFYLGFLIEYGVAPYISIAYNGWLLTAAPVLFLILCPYLPETPYYHLMQGNTMKAKKSLMWLRNKSDVNDELTIMEEVAKEENKNRKGVFDLFTVPSSRKALFIVLGLSTAQQITGRNAIVSYAQLMFEEAQGAISPEISGIILALTSFVAAALSSLLVDSWGRRPLLILSNVCVSVPLLTTGVYYYLQSVHYEHIATISLVPLISLVVFNFAYSLGMSFLPLVCLGELFPTNVRTIAACVMNVYASLAAVVVIKTYQIFADLLGTHFVFWGFAAFGFLSAFIIYLFVPETKQQSLEQIQKSLRK